MPSKWINWIKDFASKNNMSYACALTQPACREGYRAKYGVSKRVPPKVERERMGLEDVDIKPLPKRRKPAQHSKEAFKMAVEDIHSRHLRDMPSPPRERRLPPTPRLEEREPEYLLQDIYPEHPQFPVPAVRKGRKPKYATEEERKQAKRTQTLASNKKRYHEKKKDKK